MLGIDTGGTYTDAVLWRDGAGGGAVLCGSVAGAAANFGGGGFGSGSGAAGFDGAKGGVILLW